jgi:hypothetical protein
MRAYTLTNTSLAEQANISVDIYLTCMVNEGIITKEQFDQCKDYRMVYAPRSMWGKLWKYITQYSDVDSDYAFVVKIINVNKSTSSTENLENVQ